MLVDIPRDINFRKQIKFWIKNFNFIIQIFESSSRKAAIGNHKTIYIT